MEFRTKKFFQLSHSNGQDLKIIIASTKYEAIGFYLLEEVDDVASASLDKIEALPPNEPIRMLKEGFSTIKTLEEIWKEKDDWILPKTIVG